jgi:hypothetical protein
MKATIPITLSPGTKLLRIERVPKHFESVNLVVPGEWRIWLNANYNFTLGTQLVLYNDGRISNVTQNEDGSETIYEVKPADT